ncbi:MAG TPA: long-chain fatty acid--CoA ligase [Polyangiaceae bacterium]|nr:long-chain fatty acid--CoA ligase [Polyangiaceae bacterium]
MSSLTMASWVARHAETRPGRVALAFRGARWTYAQLHERVDRVASGLRERGVRKGDRVLAMLLNGPEFFELLMACNRLGAIFVPINFRLSADEVAFLIDDAAPEIFAYQAPFRPIADAYAARGGRRQPLRVELGEGAPAAGAEAYAALAAGGGGGLVPAPVLESDPAIMMYTSGTTGRPKGALLSHGNLLWNNMQVLHALSLGDDEVNYTVAPLFHIGGLNVLTGPLIYKGATTVVDDQFEPRRALAALASHRATAAFMVPAMWAAISRAPDFDAYDLKALRTCLVGGAPCPLPVLEFYQGRGFRFQEGFGMTETAPIVSVLAAEDVVRKNGSVGKPCIHVEVRVVDAADREVARGEVGELAVRAPNVMLGYWNRPEASAEALRGGWMHTGDLARVDGEGFVYIVDRKKDMIITGGENVYPAEVEQVLVRHPKVLEVAVIGLPDERWGEAVAAVVACKPGESLGLDELRAYCEGKLARYKQPLALCPVDALPRNATGKVLKTELRQRFAGTPAAVWR